MQKKIVMIGNTSWGMLRFRGDLMRHLVSSGHKVTVIAPLDEWSQKIKDLGVNYIDVRVDRKGTNPIRDLVYISKLLNVLLSAKPDVTLSYTIKPVLYGTFAAWLANVPQRIAITTGLGHTFSSDNLVNKITKILYRIFLRFSSEVWFLNSDDQDTFLKGHLIPETKSYLLPGEGVDIDHFCPSSKSHPSPTFTLISRMLWDKGVGIFAECAKDLKQEYPYLNFLLVGPVDLGNPEGIPLAQLEEWHNQGFLNYLGATDDVRSILEKSTCLIHPTYYREGLPRILMEANAMGLPCITTDIPGCREVIKDSENGFLIRPKNKEDLKESIKKFLSLKKEDRIKMSQASRMRITQMFSSEKINYIYANKLML